MAFITVSVRLKFDDRLSIHFYTMCWFQLKICLPHILFFNVFFFRIEKGLVEPTGKTHTNWEGRTIHYLSVSGGTNWTDKPILEERTVHCLISIWWYLHSSSRMFLIRCKRLGSMTFLCSHICVVRTLIVVSHLPAL